MERNYGMESLIRKAREFKKEDMKILEKTADYSGFFDYMDNYVTGNI